MGITSDILEFNRERALIDPCMFIHKSKHSVTNYTPLWLHYCGVGTKSQGATKSYISEAEMRDREFTAQVRELQRMSEAEKTYISFHYLLDICIYREKQLLALKNQLSISTHLVNDAIDEYIAIVRESWQHAANEMGEAKKCLDKLPNYTFCVDDDAEREVPVVTLLESLFYHLAATAEFDDSQLLQAVFIDISQLIKVVNMNTVGKKPKEICREYYVSAFQPSFGIARCDNCGEPLYDGFHYCFNCFERS